jgi:hypothetical protein
VVGPERACAFGEGATRPVATALLAGKAKLRLTQDDGADYVDRKGRVEVLDARAQVLVKSSQTFRVAGICGDRVHLAPVSARASVRS